MGSSSCSDIDWIALCKDSAIRKQRKGATNEWRCRREENRGSRSTVKTLNLLLTTHNSETSFREFIEDCQSGKNTGLQTRKLTSKKGNIVNEKEGIERRKRKGVNQKRN